MKRTILIMAVVISVAGCKNYKSELEQSNAQRDSIVQLLAQSDESLNTFADDFREIQRNLDSVAQRQNIITRSTMGKSEISKSAKESINDNIAAINNLMDENRKLIAELNKKLGRSNAKMAKFEKMIASLNEQIANKDRDLSDLNTQLGGLNMQVAQLRVSVDTLTSINTMQSGKIEEQTRELHTAYYIMDNKKNLEDKKIIDRQGGLLGIGKTSVLKKDFDNSKFTKIDYTQTTTLPVNKKEVKVITSHPTDSYSLDRDKDKVTNLRITIPEKFWSQSKYLVVVYE